MPKEDVGHTQSQGRPFWDLGKQSLGKPSPKCRCLLRAVPGFTGAEGLSCVLGGGSGTGTPVRLGAEREMGQGQSTVPPVPLPWGAAGGAELPAWLQQSPCLSPAPWGRVAAPCLQQGVEVHSPDREGPCALLWWLPPPAPVPVTGAAVSLQSRMCGRSATKSTRQSSIKDLLEAPHAAAQAPCWPVSRLGCCLSHRPLHHFLSSVPKISASFSLSVSVSCMGGDSGHGGEGQ